MFWVRSFSTLHRWGFVKSWSRGIHELCIIFFMWVSIRNFFSKQEHLVSIDQLRITVYWFIIDQLPKQLVEFKVKAVKIFKDMVNLSQACALKSSGRLKTKQTSSAWEPTYIWVFVKSFQVFICSAKVKNHCYRLIVNCIVTEYTLAGRYIETVQMVVLY